VIEDEGLWQEFAVESEEHLDAIERALTAGGTDRPTVDGVHFDRNSFRNDDYWRLDLRLQKSFNLGPGEVSLIAECFNVTDEGYFYVSNTTWGTGQEPLSTFGLTSYGLGSLSFGGIAPRTWQFAVRYDF
jgi:hypothetical protein